jgi:hypothetical protein
MLRAQPERRNAAAVLLLREKTILVDGKPVKLFSFDSKTWFSKPADFAQFKQRCGVVVASSRRLLAQLPDDDAAVNVSANRRDEVPLVERLRR